MQAFMDKDFLLETETARHLFHDFAEKLPLVDYHCHLNPREIFEEFVSRDDRVVLLAEADGETAGFLFALIRHVKNHRAMKDQSMIYVDDLCVAQAYRRHGIGSLLLKEAEKIGLSHGCTRIELDVQAFNDDAVRFYEAVGFTPRKITMEKGIG